MYLKRIKDLAGLVSSRRWLCFTIISLVVIVTFVFVLTDFFFPSKGDNSKKDITLKEYMVISCPTPNYDKDRTNEVLGVVLHHTAEPSVEKSLAILTSPQKKVGTHVVIDTDGTRYIMAEPTTATYHAGRSILNGHEGCKYCTVGIEFQGNTLERPLTDDQIFSGIEYLLPILATYNVPLENVVTHEMVRTAYIQTYPNKRCSAKVDITQTEYARFMKALKPAWEKYSKSTDSSTTKL